MAQAVGMEGILSEESETQKEVLIPNNVQEVIKVISDQVKYIIEPILAEILIKFNHRYGDPATIEAVDKRINAHTQY